MLNSDNIWQAVAAVASVVQAVLLIGAFWYGVSQVKQLGQQLKISRITSIRDELHEVNAILLRYPNQAKLVDETPESAFASIIMNTFHTWFEFREGHLIDKDEWRTDYEVIRDYMSKPVMYEHWLGDLNKPVEEREAHRKYYDDDFVKVIDCAIPAPIREQHGLPVDCKGMSSDRRPSH